MVYSSVRGTVSLWFVFALFSSNIMANINLIEGQPQFGEVFLTMSDLTGSARTGNPVVVSLRYKGENAAKSTERNDVAPVGWCGFGWYMGYPSIRVAHGNTVDLSDDAWFHDDGNGTIQPIIRFFDSGVEKFRMPNNPLVKIDAIDNDPAPGEQRTIIGWRTSALDGTIQEYGYVEGEDSDALRYVPCWGNTISPGENGYSTPNSFYYQWDLKRSKGVDGKIIKYAYNQFERTTEAGFTYIRESYISEIHNPTGDKIVFELDSHGKDQNEWNVQPAMGGFDFTTTWFLDKVSLIDCNEETINLVDLIYSGDFGQVDHLNHDREGYAKRLLTAIRVSNDKAKHYDFTYHQEGDFCGYLKNVVKPIEGTKISHSYENRTHLWAQKELNTEFGPEQWDNTNIVLSGNHLFCIYEPTEGNITFELYDKTSMQWGKTTISGITDIEHANAKLYTFGDCFVFVFDPGDGAKYRIYKYVDRKWHFMDGLATSEEVDDLKFEYGGTYVVMHRLDVLGNREFQVHNQSPDTEDWITTSFVIDNPGRSLVNAIVKATRHYFVCCYRTNPISGVDHRVAKVFRRIGRSWDEDGPLKLYPISGSTEANLAVFPEYFIVSDVSEESTPTKIAIRRRNPHSQDWDGEYFTNTDLVTHEFPHPGYFEWPRKAMLNCGPGYVVLHEFVNDDWVMIYRRQHTGSGNYEWKRTYIDATSPCSSPRIIGGGHDFQGGAVHHYAKNFDYSIDYVRCAPSHFAVVGMSNGFLWDFRWDGDHESGMWRNAIEGISEGKDSHCQGHEVGIGRSIEQLFCNTETVGAWIYYDYGTEDGYTYRLWTYDYDASQFVETDVIVVYSDFQKPQQSDKIYAFLDRSWNVIVIVEEFGNVWFHPVSSEVTEITVDDPLSNPLSTYYEYSGKREIDFDRQVSRYGVVTNWVGEGAPAGKTVREFALDSTQGFHGQMFATSTFNNDQLADPPDDKVIKVSGWMTELDGYTPKSGWVQIRLIDGTTSALTPIDPLTGRFSVERDNPLEKQYSLDFVPVSDGGTYSIAFYVHPPTHDVFYTTRSGSVHSRYSSNEDMYKWENVMLAVGNDICEWSEGRRPSGVASQFQFWGTKEISLGKYHSAELPRLVRAITIKDGVQASSETPFDFYNDENNQAAVSYRTNSDGRILVSKTSFAHEKYGGMNSSGSHMLMQTAGSVVYGTELGEVLTWKDGVQKTIGPSADPYSINIFTGEDLSGFGKNDRITVSSVYRLTSCLSGGDMNIDAVSMSLRINGNTRIVHELPHVTCTQTPPQGDFISYRLADADLPISSVELIFDDVDYEMSVLLVTGRILPSMKMDDEDAIAASATVWSNEFGAWRQSSRYRWKVSVVDGDAVEPLSAFDYSDPQSNIGNNWIKGGAITRYSSFGHAIETQDVSGTKSSVVIRSDLFLPISDVSNGGFFESSSLPGDYEVVRDDPVWWDEANGWEKGQTDTPELVDDPDDIHFGRRAIKMENDYGVTRNSRVYPGTAYTMSAWVKVWSGTINMGADFRYANAGHEDDWPILAGDLTQVASPGAVYATPLSEAGCNGKWKLMTLQIPAAVTAQLDPGKVWFARAWIGGDPGGATFTAYVDDVRFHPHDAQVTTTFLHPKWRTPILRVDANNNPVQRIFYDEFGRPEKWYKVIDEELSASEISNLTLVREKEYHIMGELADGEVLKLNMPNGGGSYDVGKRVHISWVHDGIRDIILSYRKPSGSWNTIATEMSYEGGVHSYSWVIPSHAVGTSCKIRVSDGTNHDESDEVFTVFE